MMCPQVFAFEFSRFVSTFELSFRLFDISQSRTSEVEVRLRTSKEARIRKREDQR